MLQRNFFPLIIHACFCHICCSIYTRKIFLSCICTYLYIIFLSLILYAQQSWLRHSSLCWGATCEWVCAGRGDPGLWGTVSPRRQHHSYLCQKVRVVCNVYFISGELSWWQFRPNWALSDAHTVQNIYILYNLYASNLQFPFSDPWEQPGNEVRTTATVLATLYPNMACDVKCMLMSFCCTKAESLLAAIFICCVCSLVGQTFDSLWEWWRG